MTYSLICTKCKTIYIKEPVYKCEKCGGIIDIEYKPDGAEFRKDNAEGVFKYSKLLPVSLDQNTSLGEGETPLIKSSFLSKETGIREVWLKNEGCNPSGSFKDRASAVAISKCRQWGMDTAVIASSGNASGSAAAYCARYNVKLVVLVPERTPENKIAQALAHDPTVVKVKGAYSNSFRMAKELAEEFGWFNITSTFINPYVREGYKTIAYELFYGLKKAPDWIIIPVGAGPIFAAVYKAFFEMKSLGLVDKIPRLVCVQAKRCSPIAGAFLNEESVNAWEGSEPTIASGINDDLNGYTEDGDYTIDCIKAFDGTAVVLEEDEILKSILQLGQEGIYAEPAGAVGAGALIKLKQEKTIKENESAVIIVTGNGLKNPQPIKDKKLPVIDSIEEFNELI